MFRDHYLGVTFYELFTGKLPFESKDAMELVHCHIAKQPTPPHEINPDLPPIISSIIMKLLEKTAEYRYQSAWGIKADLEKVQKNLTGLEDLSGLSFELAQQDISDRFQIPPKLYGREAEIQTLLTAFERVTNCKVEMMLVGGYSGIGKSVLVKEIYKSLTEKRGYFIVGKFDQFQRNIPYSAMVNAFTELAQLLLTEKEEQLAIWKDKLLTALGPNGQVIIDVIPEIELIIGPQPPVPTIGPTESQNRFNLVFQNFIRVFSQPEHPLVVFLDDLQWADLATLKLLEVIMTDKDTEALFLIGAYRDNEVDSAHPFMMTLDKLGKENVTINQITLKALAFEHINQLLVDSLLQDQTTVEPLTALVIDKTGGNPFFVNQFLRTLYEENLLHFVPPTMSKKGGWQWDVAQIEAMNITDNVVDLMIGKLRKLPELTQHVIRLAACVGNRFDLKTLAIIYEKSVPDSFQDMMQALKEGLILPTSELEIHGEDIRNSKFAIQHFQFLHDRVQQAAYALIDEVQKQAVHLQIGRLLLANTTSETLEERIFDIIEQINQALKLVTAQTEKTKISELNLKAGQKAKLATAYQAAIDYFAVGIQLLGSSLWEQHCSQAFELHKEQGECEFLLGHFNRSEQLLNLALEKAQSKFDKVDVYAIKIVQQAGQGEYPEAISAMIEGVNMFDLQVLTLAQTERQKEATAAEMSLYYANMKNRLLIRSIICQPYLLVRCMQVANQAKSVFLANMSHELRSPLNAILGFAQILTRSQRLDKENQENVGIISRSGEHLLSLINQVLDLSKIEAGRTTINENHFDFYRLLDDLEDMFHLKSDDKHLQLLFEREASVPQYLYTDEVKVRQVLINLLNNALKFTVEGGITVRVNTNAQADLNQQHSVLEFAIEDTGPGIAPDELGDLFKAFVQTSTGKQSQEGTGLGLPISRKFVQLMGGDVVVTSEVGQGTTFKFHIECQLSEANNIKRPVHEKVVIALAPDQPRYRILIVDDKWPSRQLLIKLLNPLGFELREAVNGQEAVEVWEEWQPHLIWMDMRMPVMDGYEAIQQIRKHTKGQATAIVALTASVLEEERAVILDAGCDDFLRKPFKEGDIFELMHKHIGVNYVYEDSHESDEFKGYVEIPIEDIKSEIMQLPNELLTKLQEAIETGDLQAMLPIIEAIGETNKPLANTIAKLVHGFRFDTLQEVFED